MKRIAFIVALLVGTAFGQSTTITGTLKDLSGANVTAGKVTFTLAPSRDTTISGLARFSPQTVTCVINGSGLIKALDGVSTCTITQNTALQPPGSYYVVGVWPNNVKTSTFTFYAVLSSYDWSTVVPTPTTSPAQNFVDIFSNQTIGGNKIWSGTHVFNGSVSFPGGITGPVNPTTLNNRQMCDQYTGATFDAKVNACIAAVIAAGGGIADASGIIGSQSQTSPINVGNGSSIPVTLITSPWLIDNITITTAGACAFKVFNESRMMGTLHGITHSGIFQTSASTSMGSVICSAGSSPSYMSVQGAQIYNPNGATLTNGAVYANNLFDVSEFRDLMIASYGTIGLHVQAACCGAIFTSIVIDGNHVANSIPLQIDSLAGDPQPVAGAQFIDMSVDHPGTGKNNIVINNTFASSNSACSVDFTGLYMESNNSDTVTPFVKISGCNRTNWTGVTAQSRAAVSTQHVWSLLAGGGGALRPRISVKGFNFFNSTQTYPAPVIDDVNFTALIMSDSIGNLTNWDNRISWMAGLACPEASNAAGAEAVAEAGVDIFYCDATSHTLKGSYNNGSFFNMTQTIGTGTSTSNGTIINAGTSQAQPAITVTGATTSDTATCSLNAAPVATWQTGIQLLPAVVTANTVTPWLGNPTAGNITPAATVIRCTVTR